MGYFWPPPPTSYDPTPRPLRWSGSIQGGIGTLPRVDDLIPSDEDANAFIVPFGICDTVKNLWPNYAGCSYDVHAKTPTTPEGYTVFAGIWGWLGSKSARATGFRSTKSPYQRLQYYARMFLERAPEDPPGGGLPPDSFGIANSIVINYWDCSDDVRPKRKRVTYKPKQNGIDTSVEEWDPFKQAWGPEGFDAERDLVSNVPTIIKLFVQVTSAAIAYLTANPALASAWAQVGGMAASAVGGGPPPSLEAFASGAIAYLGAAPGAFDSFGKIMANVSSPVSSSDFVQSFRGAIVRMGQEGEAYYDKLRKAVVAFQGSIPKLDYASALKGELPKEISSLGPGVALDFHLASQAFQFADDLALHSYRKIANDKDMFDATYAAIQASAPVPQHAAPKITGDLTPIYAAPLEQQLATWQQLYAYWSSKNRPEAPLALKKIATIQSELANQKAALADPKARSALYAMTGELLKRYK